MRAAVHADDPRVVNHLHVHDECIPGLEDLVVAVVGIRQHRRPGGEKREALILKTQILGVLRAFDAVQPAPLDGGGRWCERRNASIGRVGDD